MMMMVRYNVVNELNEGRFHATMVRAEIMKAERPLKSVPIREGATGGISHLTSALRPRGSATMSRRLT